METFQLWEGEGQAGRVAMDRRSRHLYDPDGISSSFFPAGLYQGEDFIAYDAVPLVVKGEVKGVIEAFHRAPYSPSSEWIQLLEALALETAIAIDNAELLEKLQRSNQDLKSPTIQPSKVGHGRSNNLALNGGSIHAAWST